VGGKAPEENHPTCDKISAACDAGRESVIVLDLLSDLLHGGHYWVQNAYHDKQGRHCLVGGLEIIRARLGGGDRAGEYLSRAIRGVCGEHQTIIDFNDSRESYAEIRAVILRARELAQRVIVDYADDAPGSRESGHCRVNTLHHARRRPR
jgi:hypothetical protein